MLINNNTQNKKGFGGTVSTLIMFIAIMTVTTGLVITFVNYVKSTEDSFLVQEKLSTNKIKTSITISNIYYNTSSQNLYVYVKNIGETKMYTKNLDIFINNAFYNDFNSSYADNLSKPMILFEPQNTLTIIKNINLGSGTHEVRVNTEYGNAASDSFNI